MANQIFLRSYPFSNLRIERPRERNTFRLDLHKCGAREAADIVRTRIGECGKYGIMNFEIIYGTPDSYEGSLAEAVNEELKNAKQMNQIYYVTPTPAIGSTTLCVKKAVDRWPQDARMQFTGFSACHESQRNPWHQASYFPLRDFVDLEILIDEICVSDPTILKSIRVSDLVQFGIGIARALPSPHSIKFGKEFTEEGRRKLHRDADLDDIFEDCEFTEERRRMFHADYQLTKEGRRMFQAEWDRRWPSFVEEDRRLGPRW